MLKTIVGAAIALLVLGWAELAVAGGWGAPVTITGYYVWDTGSSYITTTSNQNPDGCSSAHYLYLDSNSPNFKQIYATVMVAQVTGQSVSLSYAGCVGPYPYINSVALPNIW
jgi:hypothetical protein